MQINITNGTLTQVQETLSPASGYELPSSITVIGATSSYNASTGLIELINCTSSMSLEATAQQVSSSHIKFGNLTIEKMSLGSLDIKKVILNGATIYESGDTPTPVWDETDLTGTTWLFNDSLARPDSNYTWDINFTSYNTSFIKLVIDRGIGWANNEGINYYTSSNSYISVYGNVDKWATNNVGYQTISITGGNDVTNQTLIGFLLDYATLVSYNPA